MMKVIQNEAGPEKLNVSYNHLQKIRKMYDIMERCKCVDAFITKVHNPYRGKYPLGRNIMGMHPAYPPHRLRRKNYLRDPI